MKIIFFIKKISLVTMFAIISCKTIAQNENRISWTGNIELSWQDFLDTITDPGKHDAKIYTAINYEFKETDEYIEISILAFFDKEKSIRRGNLNLSNELLTHELFHFHITEFIVRKFRKSIINILNISVDKFDVKIISLFDNYWQYHTYLQSIYDKDTNHGLNKSEQERWQKNITDSLHIFDDYKHSQIKIPIRE